MGGEPDAHALDAPSPLPPRPRALAALTIALGAGPAGAAGTFRIAVGVDLDTVDPAQMTTTTVANMVDYVAETLTSLGPDGKVQPWLAESWTLSPDGTTYTFKLRKGVVFHDGTPFDAKAVKWNFDRLKDPQVRVPIRAPFPIKETEAVDASTVKVTLTRPSAPFISALVADHRRPIVSPASADKQGNEYKNIVHTVGTGPYVFKERKKGESFTVTPERQVLGQEADLRHGRLPDRARGGHAGEPASWPARSTSSCSRPSPTSRRSSATRP